MATLTNTQISVTYVGLLKTSANTVLSSTAQQITDGSGNNSILFLSTAGVGIGGAAASGKELDVTGNVLVTGDLQVDNLNIDVISDFRNFDISKGGMGAPLIPEFHKYIYSEDDKKKLISNFKIINQSRRNYKNKMN